MIKFPVNQITQAETYTAKQKNQKKNYNIFAILFYKFKNVIHFS